MPGSIHSLRPGASDILLQQCTKEADVGVLTLPAEAWPVDIDCWLTTRDHKHRARRPPLARTTRASTNKLACFMSSSTPAPITFSVVAGSKRRSWKLVGYLVGRVSKHTPNGVWNCHSRYQPYVAPVWRIPMDTRLHAFEVPA